MDIKEKKYMFLCDQKRPCKNSIGCGVKCRHTADINHVKSKTLGLFMRDASDPNLFWQWEGEEK